MDHVSDPPRSSLKALDWQVLRAFPDDPVNRMSFLMALPLTMSRNSAIGAMQRLMSAGLLRRLARGQYQLTDAGRTRRGSMDEVRR